MQSGWCPVGTKLLKEFSCYSSFNTALQQVNMMQRKMLFILYTDQVKQISSKTGNNTRVKTKNIQGLQAYLRVNRCIYPILHENLFFIFSLMLFQN